MYIVIMSPGGYYHEAKKLRVAMAKLKNAKLICLRCDSAAGVLFATTGLPRLVTRGSTLLMHEAFMPRITAAQIVNPNVVSQLVAGSAEFNREMYETIGISEEEYLKKIVGTEWVLEGPAIIQSRLADTVVYLRCDTQTASLLGDRCHPQK